MLQKIDDFFSYGEKAPVMGAEGRSNLALGIWLPPEWFRPDLTFAHTADPGRAPFFLDMGLIFRAEIFPGAEPGDWGGLSQEAERGVL
jgi:hypothetical protein